MLRSEGLGLDISQGLDEEAKQIINRLGVGSDPDQNEENRQTVSSKCSKFNQNKNNTRQR